MIRIVHTFGARAGAVDQVQKTVIRFGRAPDNDIVFDPNHDRDAGSYHAELRAEGGRWYALDLQSKNGLFLRGRRIAREALQHGDELVFGANGPRVRIELEAQAQAMPGAAPVVTQPPAAPPPAAPPPAAPQAPHQAGPYQAAPQPAVPHAPLPQAAHHAAAVAAAAAAPPPVAGAPAAGGKRVGKKTMAFMIGSAVQAATRRPRTQEIKMMVDQQVDQTSKGHRRRAYVLGFLVLVALGTLGLIVAWGVRSQDDIQELREELAELPPEDPRRKDIESRLGELHPSNANFGRNLYDKYQKGIFMLAARGQGFCTAFAIKKNVLATNAHCVKAAERAGGTITAVENEGRGKVKFRVKSMKAHPGYRPDDATRITEDVGIVKIDGKAAVVLSRAKKSELKKSGAGEEIYLIGFPGRLMDADNPAATFLSANIGRVTKPDGKPGGFSSTWLVQHDAVTTKGTSGSPIFNGQGKVIAINAGGYLEGDDQTIAGRKTEVVKASPYKFGMRIDLLDKIL